MSTTIFLSKPSYLPIYRENTVRDGIKRTHYTEVWSNFITSLDDKDKSDLRFPVQMRKWNGKLINDVVVFKSDKDKMWFILKWS
jgi:hypothetical protein